jgi:hypothetical protein
MMSVLDNALKLQAATPLRITIVSGIIFAAKSTQHAPKGTALKA